MERIPRPSVFLKILLESIEVLAHKPVRRTCASVEPVLDDQCGLLVENLA
jgi:hypothetical protein